MKLFEILPSIITWVGRTVLGVIASLCIYFSLSEIAGKTTDFRAMTDVAFKFDVTKYAGYAIATLVGVGWYRERRARKSATQQTSGRVHELEAIIDAKRTSSGLNTDGSDPTGDVA